MKSIFDIREKWPKMELLIFKMGSQHPWVAQGFSIKVKIQKNIYQLLLIQRPWVWLSAYFLIRPLLTHPPVPSTWSKFEMSEHEYSFIFWIRPTSVLLGTWKMKKYWKMNKIVTCSISIVTDLTSMKSSVNLLFWSDFLMHDG